MLELQKAGKQFNSRWIFRNLNLTIKQGDFISIIGPSGCGKSTLLRILSGLDVLSEGILQSSVQSSGFVFQEACLLPWLSVFENTALGIQNTSLSKSEIESQILKTLAVVKMRDSKDLFPHELSGGMKMRVSIARALVNNKSILFMDEPFAALDDFIRFELQEELLDYSKKHGMTVLFVTHSVNESVFLSQKLWLFPQGPQKDFQELELQKPAISPSKYRNSAEYFKTATEISERLRGEK